MKSQRSDYYFKASQSILAACNCKAMVVRTQYMPLLLTTFSGSPDKCSRWRAQQHSMKDFNPSDFWRWNIRGANFIPTWSSAVKRSTLDPSVHCVIRAICVKVCNWLTSIDKQEADKSKTWQYCQAILILIEHHSLYQCSVDCYLWVSLTAIHITQCRIIIRFYWQTIT